MNWNPYMSYVWTLKEVHKWLDRNGVSAFYDGVLWEIVAKRIVPGRYHVTFKKSE